MEADKNFFPELTLGMLDRAKEIGHRVLRHLPEAGYRGEHFPVVDCPDEVPPPEMRLPGFDLNGEYQEA